VRMCDLVSLPQLIKPPEFNHGDSTLMTTPDPNKLSKVLSLHHTWIVSTLLLSHNGD
jgi:hypothetical protein